MKNPQTTIVIIVLLVVAAVAFLWPKKHFVSPSPSQVSSIEGCYVVANGKDMYTLHIESQKGSLASGTLAFKNFEKDSSSGLFTGTYQDGILLGEYAFRSEGMDSVMEVIFKKSGDDFIRGYGAMNTDGTRFADTSKVIYDAASPLSVFKKVACPTE